MHLYSCISGDIEPYTSASESNLNPKLRGMTHRGDVVSSRKGFIVLSPASPSFRYQTSSTTQRQRQLAHLSVEQKLQDTPSDGKFGSIPHGTVYVTVSVSVHSPRFAGLQIRELKVAQLAFQSLVPVIESIVVFVHRTAIGG